MPDLVGKKRIATYERTSSEDQRERATIKTQTGEIARRLQAEPDVELVERYVDDGVSGTTPMAQRPAGGRFMRDALRGLFQEVWVYRIDRLGRDDIDPLVVWRELEQYGVKVYSVTEGVSTPFEYTIRVAMNAEERRTFLARSAAGMNRAAREGRYTGGIVPYGYMTQGRKPNVRLAPSTVPASAGMTEADVVRLMYQRLGVYGWSCRRVAEELNTLGVPPVYARDGRLVTEPNGKRKTKTKGVWTAQRVRNTVIEPVYRGELQYGRRSKHKRDVISARIDPLVSTELWKATREALKKNRLMAKNTDRAYLLRGVVRCALCGRRYGGSWHPRDGVRYRCNGALSYKQTQTDKCPATSFRGSILEPVVWADIERWLRNPGDLLDELAAENSMEAAEAVWEAEWATLAAALDQRHSEKSRLVDLYQVGEIEIPELKQRVADITEKIRALEERLSELAGQRPEPAPEADEDLLAGLRRRLDAGLDDCQRQEIVSLLAEVVMSTEVAENGRKRLTAVVTYKFPGVADACTDARAGTTEIP